MTDLRAPHLVAATVALTSLLAAAPQVGTAAPGHRMYGPHANNTTFLIDVDGVLVHVWPGDFPPGNGMYLHSDGTLYRSAATPGGPAIGGVGGGIQKRAFDGTLLWDFRWDGPDHWQHHALSVMPNGNVMFIAWDILTNAEAIALGRNPAFLTGSVFMPDSIIEVEITGPTTANVVWEWYLKDHLIQDFDPTKANFGVVADHPELLDVNYPPGALSNGDFNHANAVYYDPLRDLVVFNSHRQDEFYLIDHSTTTAEAAGHTGGAYGKGGDILYRWGNPAAYRAGTSADQQLFNQHNVYIIPEGYPGAGNVLLYNNQAGTPVGQNYSAVVELEIPWSPGGFSLLPNGTYGPAAPLWIYTAPNPTDMYSGGQGSVERLPNGNTLVDTNDDGWMFEVDSNDNKVWEHFNTFGSPTANVFQVSYYERYLWATGDSLSTSAGGMVEFDLVAGSAKAGDLYLVMGSLSGTSPGIDYQGFNLPLNLDGYFLYTVNHASGATLPGSFGVLDGLGNGAAALVVPPGVTGPATGQAVHHAFAALDPVTLAVTRTSNAVATQLVP